jgi:hypothetical protein
MKTGWVISWHQAVIALLIGFTLGTVFGQWQAKDNLHNHRKKGDQRTHMMERFNKELHLTPDQQQQIARIFESNQSQMTSLHSEMRPKFEALRNTIQAEIRKILNADQQKKFDVMNAEMEKHRKKHGKFFGSGPGQESEPGFEREPGTGPGHEPGPEGELEPEREPREPQPS